MTAPTKYSSSRHGFGLLRRCDGQALAETGIVITLLMILSLGLVEFGRAWMIGNVLTHATRDGARAAAVMPAGNRDSSGNILSTAAISTLVENQIATVVSASPSVTVSQGSTSGLPVVTVNVSVDVPYIFNLVGTGFTMTRSVTFRDEGR
jgi:Flp pilus assembly protein TadG